MSTTAGEPELRVEDEGGGRARFWRRPSTLGPSCVEREGNKREGPDSFLREGVHEGRKAGVFQHIRHQDRRRVPRVAKAVTSAY